MPAGCTYCPLQQSVISSLTHDVETFLADITLYNIHFDMKSRMIHGFNGSFYFLTIHFFKVFIQKG